MTKAEWLACQSPYNMLEFLNGKIDDLILIRFSIACCNRIRHIISDARSLALIDLIEQHLDGKPVNEELDAAYRTWWLAYENGELVDLDRDGTHEAVLMVQHRGANAAILCSTTCRESAATNAVEHGDENWKSVLVTENTAQCDLLRSIVSYPRVDGSAPPS